MNIFKEVQVTTYEVDEIICNKCGESLNTTTNPAYGKNFSGLIDATAQGGYDSKLIGDGECYQFSLCESCLVALFATFIHNPRVG